MKSYIMLESVLIYANHGVFTQETKVGNVFKIDIKIELNNQKSCLSDELDDTISYADVYEIIKKEMLLPSKLLEHAAYRIIMRLKEKYLSIVTVELKLAKQNPPVGGQVEFASVVLVD